MAKKVTSKKQTATSGSAKKRTKKSHPIKVTAAKESVFQTPQTVNQKSYLTSEQLNYFRDLLLKKLEEITGDVDNIERGALKSSRADASGDLSSMPIHMADIGSDNYEQEFSLGLMHSERQIVREIIAAIRRIDNGTYGICEGTGQPIPLQRLKGIPWTRYCVEYAQSLEKRGGFKQEQPTVYQDRAEEDTENQNSQENAEFGPEEENQDENL